MNVDVLEDEIETLNAELRASDDPKAQDRIKELIDERYRAIEIATKAQQEFDALETERATLDEWQDKARIREIIKRRAEIVLAEMSERCDDRGNERMTHPDAIQELLKGSGPLMGLRFQEFRLYAIMGPKYRIARIVGIAGAREERQEVPSAIGYMAVNHHEKKWFPVVEDVNCAYCACKRENEGYTGYALFSKVESGCNDEKLPTFADLMATAGFVVVEAE